MAAQSFPVHFHFADISFGFQHRTAVKRMIMELVEHEGKKIAYINYIFCSDAYLLALNKRYLDHDTLTDIITFHYHAKDEPLASDIYISIDRVRENAQSFTVSFRNASHCRVTTHLRYCLHVHGYQ